MATLKWLTPDVIPSDTIERKLCIPNDPQIIAAISGALLPLTYPENWEQYGSVTPAAIAAAMSDVFVSFLGVTGECMTRLGQPTFIWDKKTQNTAGGTFTLGDWRLRDLNTIEGNISNGVTLNANRFTIPAGTWLLKASAPAYAVGRHQIRLIDYPTGAQFAVGSVEQNGASADAQTRSVLVWTAIINDAVEFQIVHRSSGTKATNGFGVPGNLSDEKYTLVELYPIG